ncbi:MAG: phage antirepressor N-terminal domain-containing protein [Muribaculaceae bacterium]|nr:phage antirepressor N-terminal domain-containing protein [Muribaculaceae bacterium]
MKETISIGTINGVEIYAVKNEEGTVLVPIKPICTALGIDDKAQREKISEDEDLRSTGGLSTSVGADGKEREMFCLPEEFIYGWIFTINPKNVAPSARESVRKYRRQCYTALYRHFHGRANRLQEFVDMERQLMDRRETLQASLSELMKSVDSVKSEIKDIDKKFNDLKGERLNPTPSLFD